MAHITARMAAKAVSKKKSTGPVVRRRVGLVPFSTALLSLPTGRHYKGQWDYLRRVLKMRRSAVTYVYLNNVRETSSLILSNFPLERDDLIGCYTGTGITTAQLREDMEAAGGLQ